MVAAAFFPKLWFLFQALILSFIEFKFKFNHFFHWQQILSLVFMKHQDYFIHVWENVYQKIFPDLYSWTLSAGCSCKSHWSCMEEAVRVAHDSTSGIGAFPRENHHPLADGRSALCVLPILSYRILKSVTQELRFNMNNNSFCSSRTFWSKTGILLGARWWHSGKQCSQRLTHMRGFQVHVWRPPRTHCARVCPWSGARWGWQRIMAWRLHWGYLSFKLSLTLTSYLFLSLSLSFMKVKTKLKTKTKINYLRNKMKQNPVFFFAASKW